MRWLRYYGPIDQDEGMYEDLTKLPLQELYEMHQRIEEDLKELRMNEPSAKRKNEDAHIIWFSQCQGCIARLKEVRDAICVVKENQSRQNPNQR